MSNIPFRRRSLRFPNARLFVHGQLSCGRAAAEAIAHSACEFGLLTDHDLNSVLPAESAAPCACMATVRNILSKYCELRRNRSDAPELDGNEMWAILQEDALAFDQQSLQDLDAEKKEKRHECNKFAPVLFDLMLQELLRHP